MAAARVKADQMATPSLWQRISALLRRPPVLAFATVLVLIGGGVLIGRRGDKMQVAPRGRPGSVAYCSATAAIPAAPAQGSSAIEDDEEQPGMAEPMIPEPTFEPEKKEAPAVTHRPAPPKKAELVAGNKAEAADKAVSGAVVRRDDKPAAKPPAVKPTAEKQFAERPTAASDDFAAPAPGEVAEESLSATSTATRGAGAAKTGAASPTTTQPEPSRTAQVLAQAKAAIARGDCATARALLKRVASEDANAYRKALASDASLNSCVTAAQ